MIPILKLIFISKLFTSMFVVQVRVMNTLTHQQPASIHSIFKDVPAPMHLSSLLTCRIHIILYQPPTHICPHQLIVSFLALIHPSMVVSSIGSLSGHHSRSSSADYNDLRGELRGTQFGDQRMGAGEVYCSHWWCVYWGLQPE